MNSRDKSTILFVDMFNFSQEKTNNFTRIPPELLKENTKCLQVFRVILGLTINSFAKKMDLPYSWVYHLEKNQKKIKNETAKSYANKIYHLLQGYSLLGKVNEDEAILNFQALKGIYQKSEITIFLQELENRDSREIKNFVQLLRGRTNDFHVNLSLIILEDSRILLFIRIILGLSQKGFAQQMNIGRMTVEEFENGYRKIRWPVTARQYAEKVQNLFHHYKIPDMNIIEKRWEKWKNTRKTKEKRRLGWKSIREMSIKEFRTYIRYVKKETNNFKDFKFSLFQKSPQVLIIFRILLNLTQRDLERKLALRGRVISNYECGAYSTLSIGKAQLFAKFFKKQFKKRDIRQISEEAAIERFVIVKEAMYTHKKSFQRGLKKIRWTEQERMLFREFSKLKRKGITIQPHQNIDTGKGTINIDFVISFQKQPFLAIESTAFYHTKSRKFHYNFKRRINEADYRFIKLKKKLPEIKTILVIDIERDLILQERIKRFIRECTIEINHSFINESKASFKNKIEEEICKKVDYVGV